MKPRRPTTSRRAAVSWLVATLAIAGVTLPVSSGRAQTAAQCSDPDQAPEEFGPTDIAAASGNRRLSVGLNGRGTVTIFKWPSPSYYDQIKYRTTDRAKRRMGALVNEGAFVGVALKRKGQKGWRFHWLRELPGKQRFADDDSDEVVTTFRDRRNHVSIEQRDVVSRSQDVLYRSISIRRSRSSSVIAARVIAFANFNPVVSKDPQAPYDDWCSEEDNDAGGSYSKKFDAIVHTMDGGDTSTGESSSVALAMGFRGRSDAHDLGVDTYGTGGTPGTSAYDDAADGKLQGNDNQGGPADGAIADDLSLRSRRSASTTVLMAAARTTRALNSELDSARKHSYKRAARAKKSWWAAWLRPTSLPKDASRSVVALAKRSLITIRQNADRRGLIVRSISTQPPFGLDWIRDGAYINRALDLAGHEEMVAAHNRQYARLQATFTSKPIGGEAVPSGNWAQNYYADGVVGGTIPYEIDETGLGIWTLWDHYVQTGDRVYLLSAQVYESIQRAAQYLSDVCRDPTNGLQCVANEEDRASPSQTLVGAQAVWLGLDAAAQAARVRDTAESLANATKWEQRRDEIATAIEMTFFGEECDCYTQNYETGGTLLWPVVFVDPSSSTAAAQANVNFEHISRAMQGKDDAGAYESRALLGNSYVWTSGSERTQLRAALQWVAENTTTGGLLGGAWSVFPPKSQRTVARAGQPNAFNHAMFYLAAIRAFGKEPWSD